MMQLPPFLEDKLWRYGKRCHWSPESQPYAPAEVLLHYLAEQWAIQRVVITEHWLPTRRSIIVYSFELTNHTQTLVLPVLGNPIVRGVLHQCLMQCVPFSVIENGTVQGRRAGPEPDRKVPARLPVSPKKRSRGDFMSKQQFFDELDWLTNEDGLLAGPVNESDRYFLAQALGAIMQKMSWANFGVVWCDGIEESLPALCRCAAAQDFPPYIQDDIWRISSAQSRLLCYLADQLGHWVALNPGDDDFLPYVPACDRGEKTAHNPANLRH